MCWVDLKSESVFGLIRSINDLHPWWRCGVEGHTTPAQTRPCLRVARATHATIMFTIHYIYMCYNTQGHARYNNVYIILHLHVLQHIGPRTLKWCLQYINYIYMCYITAHRAMNAAIMFTLHYVYMCYNTQGHLRYNNIYNTLHNFLCYSTKGHTRYNNVYIFMCYST